jgi:TfoX/Sxy family transcriptional regulator of competence genes
MFQATKGKNEQIDRLRKALAGRAVKEVNMFGGVCFMLNGNMLAGTFRDETLFRVGKDADAVALQRAHTRPMEQAGRRAVGYVLVSAEGTRP